VPFTFTPELSLVDALIATAAATARVFLGSLLFAVWGTCSIIAWTSIRNLFVRTAALALLLVMFVLLLAALFAAIAAAVRWFRATSA
jgi:hypothetical protein